MQAQAAEVVAALREDPVAVPAVALRAVPVAARRAVLAAASAGVRVAAPRAAQARAEAR